MRRTIASLCLGAVTVFGAAACGVDKQGTADNLIKNIEKGAGDLTDDQKSCLTDLVEGYSDDDLRKLDKAETSSTDPLVAAFSEQMFVCISGS